MLEKKQILERKVSEIQAAEKQKSERKIDRPNLSNEFVKVRQFI